MSDPAGAGVRAVRVAGNADASNADRDRISDMFARAFADDPALSFIFPDPLDRARRLPRLFRLLFDSDGSSGMRLATPGGEAATLWRGPGRHRVGRLALVGQA